MSRRKRQPEQFDVIEFLRESDGDLKSALNSLLRSPAAEPSNDAALNPLPGPKLVPAPVKESTSNFDNTDPGLNLTPAINLGPGLTLTTTETPIPAPAPNLTPGTELTPIDVL